jgi:hypothetical protein
MDGVPVVGEADLEFKKCLLYDLLPFFFLILAPITNIFIRAYFLKHHQKLKKKQKKLFQSIVVTND